MRRGWWRRRLAVACALGRDRGASAVELAILGPSLLVLSLLIVQFALWFDARHAALAAAQQGDLVAREDAITNTNGWTGLAKTAATSYYQGLDTSVIHNLGAQAERNGSMITVSVGGDLSGLFPLHVTASVSGPIECFRTQASGGTAC
ncbi:MAG: TadE/TadG family type IV pilus assembly protein [Streptosporangiaceae bacterium]